MFAEPAEKFNRDQSAFECELAVIGSLLVPLTGAEAAGIVRARLRPEHFSDDALSAVYRAVLDTLDQRGCVSLALLKPRLPSDPAFIKLWPGFMARAAASAATVYDLPGYVDAVIQAANRRMLAQAASDTMTALRAGADPAEHARLLIETGDAVLSAAEWSRPSNASLGDAIDRALNDAEQRKANGSVPAISWGFTDLDRQTGGLEPGDYAVLAGRPGMGKTALMIAILLAAAQRGSGGVLFSLEMKTEQIALRAVCAWASRWGEPIDFFEVRQGRYTSDEIRRLREAKAELSSLPVRIDSAAGLSVPEMTARARRYRDDFARKGHRLGIVGVDYIGLVPASGRYGGNRTNEVGEISAGLKRLGMSLDVACVAASQLSRQVETRDNKRPMLSDLRDSGTIEQDADLVLFPYRESYYAAKELEKLRAAPNADQVAIMDAEQTAMDTENVLEVAVEKQRQGPTGSVRLFCNMGAGVIRDRAGC